MATAKKKAPAKRTAKSTAKRTVKYAAKKAKSATARTAPRAAAASMKAPSQASNNAWVKQGAAEWQKGANEWAKQSAKLYQLPFAQGTTADTTQHAAKNMQSATESMMKMGSDMMQQMFSQAKQAGAAASQPSMMQYMPNMQSFDASSAQEQMASFSRSSTEQMSKSAASFNSMMGEAMELARENAEAMMDVSNIALSVSKELGAEFAGYMNKLFSQNAELSKEVLSCRTLNDMFDLSGRMMKNNLDGFFSESVKMSEMMFQCATDVSEPLNERMSETSERMTRAMAS